MQSILLHLTICGPMQGIHAPDGAAHIIAEGATLTSATPVTPSRSLSPGRNGLTVWKCFAGGSPDEAYGAVPGIPNSWIGASVGHRGLGSTVIPSLSRRALAFATNPPLVAARDGQFGDPGAGSRVHGPITHIRPSAEASVSSPEVPALVLGTSLTVPGTLSIPRILWSVPAPTREVAPRRWAFPAGVPGDRLLMVLPGISAHQVGLGGAHAK